jgi:hypothetical protein
MKKLSIVVIVLLFSMVAYGSGWLDEGSYVRLSNIGDQVVIGWQVAPGANQAGEAKVYIVNGDQYFELAKNFQNTARLRLRADDTDGGIIEYTHNDPLKFYTGSPSVERMRIEGNGNVGIGTDEPQGELHVSSEDNGDAVLIIEADTDNGPGEFDNPKIIFRQDGGKDISAFENYNNELLIRNSVGGSGGISFGTGNVTGYENAVTRMSIKDDGRIGIGTTQPSDKLHISDNTLPSIKISKGTSYWGQLSLATGNGSFSNFAKQGDLVLRTDATADDIIITARNSTGSIRFGTGIGDTEKMTITSSGRVGIGTNEPQSELAVNGTITAKEVIVTTDGWPDFVFTDNHNLMSLNKLEQHVKVNKSLPGIPTEKEVLEGGVKLGDMQAKLLEKVEELTLYTIAQEKRLAQLEKENEELKKQISALER